MIVVVTMLHVRPIVGEKSLHTTQNNILHHKPMITTDCFLQNETAKNDPNIQAALKNYMLQLYVWGMMITKGLVLHGLEKHIQFLMLIISFLTAIKVSNL
jgi:hypothetical protein